MSSPIVSCPICISPLVTVINVTDARLDYCCAKCGARFAVNYPLPTADEHKQNPC